MNPALIVAASTATYLVPFLAVKWAIDRDGPSARTSPTPPHSSSLSLPLPHTSGATNEP